MWGIYKKQSILDDKSAFAIALKRDCFYWLEGVLIISEEKEYLPEKIKTVFPVRLSPHVLLFDLYDIEYGFLLSPVTLRGFYFVVQ